MIYKKNKMITINILLILGVLFYILNYYTPLHADDYSYSFSFMTGNKIKNIYDIILSQKEHYFSMNGRSVVHVIAQIFLCYKKEIFNIINSIGYISLIILIYFHSYGTLESINLKWIVSIFLILWIITPSFGQSYLWITGAANYLYGIFIILLYLIPFRKLNKDYCDKKGLFNNMLISVLYLIIGIIAGWTNENNSVALICIVILYLVNCKNNKINIKLWMISGLLGNIIGFLLMILAPGQGKRLEKAGGVGSIVSILKRSVFISIDLMKYLIPMIMLMIILITYYYNKNKIKNNIINMINDLSISIIFFIGTLASIYSMIISPSFPERAWSGPVILLTISIGNIFSKIKFDKSFDKSLKIIIVLVCMFFCTSYIEAVLKLRQTTYSFNERIQNIIEHKEDNVTEITIPSIIGYSKYDCYTRFGDLSSDSNKWPNTAIAKYYGIDSINKEKE